MMNFFLSVQNQNCMGVKICKKFIMFVLQGWKNLKTRIVLILTTRQQLKDNLTQEEEIKRFYSSKGKTQKPKATDVKNLHLWESLLSPIEQHKQDNHS